MSTKPGKIVWVDLTVENAEPVREFYQQVVGWTSDPVDMGEYNDYSMKAPDDVVAAGICHKRGSNAQLPSHWMVYISVTDLDQSLKACEAHGGKIIVPMRGEAPHRFAVIEDPAGAVCTLME